MIIRARSDRQRVEVMRVRGVEQALHGSTDPENVSKSPVFFWQSQAKKRSQCFVPGTRAFFPFLAQVFSEENFHLVSKANEPKAGVLCSRVRGFFLLSRTKNS